MIRNFTRIRKTVIDGRQQSLQIGMAGVMKMRLFHLTLVWTLLSAPSAFAQSMPLWKSVAQTGNVRNLVLSAGNDNSVAAWFGKKADAANGKLKNPNIQGGAAIGTDVSQSNISGLPATTFLSHAQGRFTTFLGSASSMELLASDVSQSLGTSKIGLYEHANGLAAVHQQADQTRAAQQITAIQNAWGKTGASIVSGGGSGFGEVAASVPSPGYLAFFGGKYPEEVAVNLPDGTLTNYTAVTGDVSPGKVYSGYLPADQEASLEQRFTAIVAASGTKLIQPVYDARHNTDDPVATSNYFANFRKLARFSGGFAMDLPPKWAVQQGSQFMQAEADLIRWGVSQGLGVTLILSPWGKASSGVLNQCAYENTFLDSTRTFVGYLQSNDALPTQYVVESYCGSTGTNTVNVAVGDDVQGSLNQVALWIASQPTSPAGTVQPGAAGTAPQNTLHVSTNAKAAMLGNRSYSPLPNANIPIVDIVNRQSAWYGNVNDMGYQNSFDFNLKAGQLGSSSFLGKGISIFLNGLSNVQSQVPFMFQGGANGNPYTGGGSLDPYFHVWNPFSSNVALTCIALGNSGDTSNPDDTICRNGKGITTSANIIAKGSVAGHGTNAAAASGSGWEMDWNASGGQGETNFVNIHPSTGVPGGFSWHNKLPTDTLGSGTTLMSLDASGNLIPSASVAGAGSDVTVPHGWVLAYNLSSGNAETDIINVKGAASNQGGFAFYSRQSTGTISNTTPALMNISGAGDVIPLRSVELKSMTKSAILAIASPVEGMAVNDSDDHVPAIYENGNWYPLQLGTALQ